MRIVRGFSLLTTLLFATGSLAEGQITHGPILGRLSSDGVGVWVRTSRPGPFRVVYGESSSPKGQTTAPVDTQLARDNTGWVHITGLKPNTKYFYRVATGSENNASGGSFRTLPRAATYRDPELNPRGVFNFSFEFGCGNAQRPGHGGGYNAPAFKTMFEKLKDKVHFSIQNGDWLYEDSRSYSPEQWSRQVGVSASRVPGILRIAPTLAGVWENYKVYLDRGRNLAHYHRNVPTFFTFDDHEILNDVWGAGSPGLRDRRAIFRDIGVQAWYDYLGWSNPVDFAQGIHFGRAELKAESDVLTDKKANFTELDLEQAATLHVHWGGPTAGVNDNALDGVGGDPNAGVYEIVEIIDRHRLRVRPAAKQNGETSYSIGRRSYYHFRVGNAEFFLTDTRTHRQMHDVRQPDKPGLSMLGPRQRKWLLDGMRASKADFLFVVSSVNFMVPHVGGGGVRPENKDDAWTVFLDEREALIEAWDALNKPVFVLTGDLHNSFAIKITDRVWEFASGPHNSDNHWFTDEGGRPANGPFQYGPRKCDIRWSTFFRDDVPRDQLHYPVYCVVQINNAFNNPKKLGQERWVAFPRPQAVFQYYDGRTGDLLYAESVSAVR